MDSTLVNSLLLPLFLLLLPCFYLLISKARSKDRNLPPGPPGWPVLGNLELATSKTLYRDATELVPKYGPLMLMKIGPQPLIIVGSSAAAAEIVKSNDKCCSARGTPPCIEIEGHIEHSLIWSDCNEHWKSLRRLCRTELFTTKMLESQSHLREQKVTDLLNYIRSGKEGQIVKVCDLVFVTVSNMQSNMIFSMDKFLYEGEDEKRGLRALIRHLTTTTAQLDVSDLIPILRPFDLMGLKRTVRAGLKPIFASWEETLRDRRATKDHSRHDLLDVMIEQGFNDPTINALVLEMLGGGSDTMTAAVEWTLAELIKHPDMLSKLRQEIEDVVGNRPIKESDLPNLPYLHACVKESLRLHPPAPFVIPRRCTQTFQAMNYTIPIGCHIFINVDAIGKDPEQWVKPLEYWPERFMGSDVDYQGNHLQLIPFGAGRRICVAISFASRAMRLVLGSLVQSFDWDLPNGMNPHELRMTESFGLTLVMDPPLLAIPTCRA